MTLKSIYWKFVVGCFGGEVAWGGLIASQFIGSLVMLVNAIQNNNYIELNFNSL